MPDELTPRAPACPGVPTGEEFECAAALLAEVRRQGLELRLTPVSGIRITRDGQDLLKDTGLDAMTLTDLARLKRPLLLILINRGRHRWPCLRCGKGEFDLPEICATCSSAEKRPAHA